MDTSQSMSGINALGGRGFGGNLGGGGKGKGNDLDHRKDAEEERGLSE